MAGSLVQVAAVIFLLALPPAQASKLGAHTARGGQADAVRKTKAKKASTDESLIDSAFSEYEKDEKENGAASTKQTPETDKTDRTGVEKILDEMAERAAAEARRRMLLYGANWEPGPDGLVGPNSGEPVFPADVRAKLFGTEDVGKLDVVEMTTSPSGASLHNDILAPTTAAPTTAYAPAPARETFEHPDTASKTKGPLLDPPDIPETVRGPAPAPGPAGPAPGFALPASPLAGSASTATAAPVPIISSTGDDPKPVFEDGWQQKLIDPYFARAVTEWGGAEQWETCAMEITHRTVVGYTAGSSVHAANISQSVTVDVIEKHVQVEVPKIVEERVPFDVTVTHDRMIYMPTKQTVPRYVEIEKVEMVKKEVEVPRIVEVVRNVTIPGPINQVTKTVEKNVTMEVVTVRVDQVSVPMTVTEEKPVYYNVSQKVTRQVTIPKFTTKQRQVNVTRIQEVVKTLPAGSNVTYAPGYTGTPPNEKIEVEVAKVTIREVKVRVEIIQDKVVYKTVKQRVERRVEKPEVQIKQKVVEVPEYREVIKEVPVVEVRNRTVELVREELEIDDVIETVNITKERLIKNPTTTRKEVKVVTETPEFHYTEVPLTETRLSVVNENSMEIVSSIEWTNITQQKLVKKEVIEYVDKYVDVMIEQEEIVEVPRYTTKTVVKEVIVETYREEIVQVPEKVIVNITREEPEEVFEELKVELVKEHIVTKQIDINKEMSQEICVPVPTWSEVEVVSLVPKPFPIQEKSEEVNLAHDQELAVSGEEEPEKGSYNMTEEVIVQDFVHKEVIKKVAVPNTVVQTRDVTVPVFQIEEEIIEVHKVKYVEDIVEVEKIYEQEKIVEVTGPATEEVFEEEVIVPHYVPKQVVARVEVPRIEVNQTELRIPVYRLEEEVTTVEREIVQEELVEVEQVLEVTRYVIENGTDDNAGAAVPNWGNNDHIVYVETPVEQVVEVPEHIYIDREVIVPVYEVEEVIVEVPKITIIEEIVEVPRIVEIQKIVEVPVIEYNDIVVEKVIHKHVLQTKQVPNITTVDKVVFENSETLHLDESVKSVPFQVEVPSWTATEMSVTQKNINREVGDITQKVSEVEVPKEVIVTRRVERLVPREVIKIIKVNVEILREVIVEKVVPIIKETIVKKEVKVPVMAVKEIVVKKPVKQQVVTASSRTIEKPVELKVEFAVNRTTEVQVPISLSLKPRIRTKDVNIAIPCANSVPPPSTTSPGPGPAPAPAPGPGVDVV